MNEVKTASSYPTVQSYLVFSWLCEECAKLNQMTWDTYVIYGRTVECGGCEKAYTLKTPWE